MNDKMLESLLPLLFTGILPLAYYTWSHIKVLCINSWEAKSKSLFLCIDN